MKELSEKEKEKKEREREMRQQKESKGAWPEPNRSIPHVTLESSSCRRW